jgi:hypothetical protein
MVLTLSRKVDECKPLPGGAAAAARGSPAHPLLPGMGAVENNRSTDIESTNRWVPMNTGKSCLKTIHSDAAGDAVGMKSENLLIRGILGRFLSVVLISPNLA